MKSIQFIGVPELDLVKMQEVKGGLAMNSYAGGCNSHEHQVDAPIDLSDKGLGQGTEIILH